MHKLIALVSKHILGRKNYGSSGTKSTLEHSNPQALVDKNAHPGMAVYKEMVDFGEFIGYFVDKDTGEKIATSWGVIHYAKDGTHIVPAKPKR